MASGNRKNKKGQGSLDKRLAGERIPIQLLVDYKEDGHYLFDFCLDLGEGGVFVETKKPCAPGSYLDLTFTLPDSNETVSMQGKVIWVQEPMEANSDARPGMGIQFIGSKPEDRKSLAAFVKRYSHMMSKTA